MRRMLCVAVPIAGAIAGLAAALIWPWQHDADHSCPAFATADVCLFPPDLVRQRIEWAVLDLTAGGAIAWLLWVLTVTNRSSER